VLTEQSEPPRDEAGEDDDPDDREPRQHPKHGSILSRRPRAGA